MWFLVFKLLRIGAKEVKKRRAAKNQASNPPPFHPGYPTYPPPPAAAAAAAAQPQPQHHAAWYSDPEATMHRPKRLEVFTGRAGDPRSPAKILADFLLRFLQFVMGLTVIGLYGVDLRAAHKKNVSADSKWVYAVVTAGMACITASIYLIAPFVLGNRPAIAVRRPLHLPCFVWECIMFIFWLTLFGIFGKMYISEDPEGDSAIERMKHAVWVDLTNLFLWCASAVWCGLRWFKNPQHGDSNAQFASDKLSELGN